MTPRTPAPFLVVALLVLTAASALATLGPAVTSVRAAEPNFPAKDSLYHNYPEMVAAIDAAVAAHPDIIEKLSIGKSYQGRDLWAVKISDNVATDEAEPEILLDSLHHAREHISVEQTLAVMRWLTDGYGVDPRITNIVNSREIWIVFMVNPDGGQYDLTGTPYRGWRKTRQPTPHSTYIGTDPNRNYGYHWGCCSGSSSNPASITYRGRAPWSSREVQVVRDFVNSRVIGGRQQIKAHITFHTNGQLILWPYGYTKTDVPWDMTVDDHAAFVALGKGMAARNGYKAMQSSDLYITDGDQIDWLYGAHRIFSFTWELYPPETATVWGDHYPPDEVIAPQTARNRSALLYLINVGACPWGQIGKAKADCGPLFDDLEINRGWQVNPDGTDTATAGIWQRANPRAISVNRRFTLLGTTTSGIVDFVPGAAINGAASKSDVDGGTTTIRSAAVDLPATVGALSFRYYFSTAGSSAADSFRAYVEDDTGARTLVFQKAGTGAVVDAAWATARVAMTPWAGHSVRLVFTATDGATDSRIEAGLDDVRIEQP